MNGTTEPWVPVPPPEGPRFEARELPLCPTCKGLARRTLGDPSNGKPHGPWRCDLHGKLDTVEFETLEIPAGYDDE